MREKGDGEWGRSDRVIPELDRSVDDEVEFHLEMRVRENLARGMSAQDAREEAERRFGDASKVRAQLRSMGRKHARVDLIRERLGDLIRDLRFAARALRRRPGFSVLAVVTLALGIGATTAVFSLADWLLLRPVEGVHSPWELATVRFGPEGSGGSYPISHLDYLELANGAGGVTGIAATFSSGGHLTLPGREAGRIDVELVSGNYAEVLGLKPLAGRPVGGDDGGHVVMVTGELALEAFGEIDRALGRDIILNGRPFTVVGIAPEGFRGPGALESTDAWVPAAAHRVIIPVYGDGILTDRRQRLWMSLVARLAPGMTTEAAQEQIRAVASRVVEATPESSLRGVVANLNPGVGLSLYARAQLRRLFTILGVVAALLTILASANAANLLLARAAGRTEELAVRRAIGAGQGRIVRQLLTEASLLSLISAGVGLGLAFGAIHFFRGERVLSWMPPMEGLEANGSVLLFTLGMAGLTGVLFGVTPSILASRRIGHDIRSGARGIRGVGPSQALVVVQMALSLTLVVGAGLLLGTVRALQATDLGFEPRGVVEASVDPGTQGYDPDRRAAFFRRVLAEVWQSHGVAAAGFAAYPVQGAARAQYPLRPEGVGRDDPRTVGASMNQISPGFIPAVGLELMEGRDFREEEMLRTGTAERVVILSAGAARQVFGEASPIGRVVDLGYSDPAPARVVGVVRDPRLAAVKESGGIWVLEPFGSSTWVPGFATLYVRGRGDETAAVAPLRSVLANLDPNLPFYEVQSLERRVEVNLTRERMLARVTALFAALALLLAAIGLYGIMAMTVQRRIREMGVRLALGADPGEVRAFVVGRALKIMFVGVGLGLMGACLGAPLLQSTLWGVRPLEPHVFLGAACTLLLAGIVASWIPAARATRVDPVEALRAE